MFQIEFMRTAPSSMVFAIILFEEGYLEDSIALVFYI